MGRGSNGLGSDSAPAGLDRSRVSSIESSEISDENSGKYSRELWRLEDLNNAKVKTETNPHHQSSFTTRLMVQAIRCCGIHGFGASLYSWRNFIGPLAKDYRPHPDFDLKGCVNLEAPRHEILDSGSRRFAMSIHSRARPAQPTLIGNSFGGRCPLLLSMCSRTAGEAARLKSADSIDAGAYKDTFCLSKTSLSPADYTLGVPDPDRFAVRAILRRH